MYILKKILDNWICFHAMSVSGNFAGFVVARHYFKFSCSCIAATDDLLSSFESPPNSNGLKNHDSIMPPSYEAAKQIPASGM